MKQDQARYGGNLDSLQVKLKDNSTVTVNPIADNAQVLNMAIGLIAMVGEGAGEAVGAIVNAVSGAVALGRGLPVGATKILDGQALGGGLGKLAKALAHEGGADYIRGWLEGGATYQAPGRPVVNLVDSFADRTAVAPDVLLLAFKLGIVVNLRDFFGSAGEELMGPLVGLRENLGGALARLEDLLSARPATDESTPGTSPSPST